MVMADRKYSSRDILYKEIEKNLEYPLKSSSRSGEPREIKKLIEGRVTINKIYRIGYGEGQPLESSNDINGKAFDFSTKTITDLIIQGIEDRNTAWNSNPE